MHGDDSSAVNMNHYNKARARHVILVRLSSYSAMLLNFMQCQRKALNLKLFPPRVHAQCN